MGRRPDLVGGGLIRSQGGWSEVMAMRKRKVRELYDERILGSGDFVGRVLEEAEKDFNRSLKTNRSPEKLEQFILKECRDADVSVDELKSGSRRAPISSIRAKLAIALVKNDGVAMATVARHLGVSTAAISLLLSRERRIS